MKARLAVNALNNAVARRANTGADVAGCIVHADRGSQFRSRKFHRALTRHGMVGSMGQVASAADNAAMELFFSCCRTTSSTGSRGGPARISGSGS
jgi:putative transposase